MEVQSQETQVESTSTESTTPTSIPQSPADPGLPAAAQADGVAGGESPNWQPNWKINVMDKEHEIPEWVRSAVKDAETEKQAREIFEKAYGLDSVKPKYQEIRKKHEDLNKEYSNVMGSIDTARQYFAKGDMESFLNHLEVPEEALLKYFIDKAKMIEAPPETQQLYQRQREAERRAMDAERRATEVTQQHEERLRHDTLSGLQAEFSKPDVSGFAKQFDTRLGREGAFLQEVAQRGQFYWKSGRYVPPSQVVSEMMQLGGYAPVAPASATMGQPGQPAAPNQVVKSPASIPGVSGRQTTPMPQKPMSIDDLEKIRKQKYGS